MYTWTKITGGLPSHQLSYVRVVAEDPNCKGLLFAGTGNSLFYSLDDGGNWTNLKNGLPSSPVSWAVVQKQFHDLVISTYGRGIYILDDITPLEQMAKGVGADTSGVVIYAASDDANFGRRTGVRKLSVEESAEGAGAGGDSR